MRRLASLAVVALAGLLTSTPQLVVREACAQDKKDDKQKKREQAKRDAALKRIAENFGQGADGVDALLARVPKTISLTLGGSSGDYSVSQARGVLEKYFQELRKHEVDTTSDKVRVQDHVGVFPLTLQKKTANKSEERKLQVTLGPIVDGSYTLAKLADNM